METITVYFKSRFYRADYRAGQCGGTNQPWIKSKQFGMFFYQLEILFYIINDHHLWGLPYVFAKQHVASRTNDNTPA